MKLHANFHKKYYYLGPLEFFENENFDMHAPARAEILELDFKPVLSDQKKFPHSTLLHTHVQVRHLCD